MVDESFKRKYVSFTDVNILSHDIKPAYNDFLVGEQGFTRYGMDVILKKYAKLNNNYRIHALLEHGIILTDYVGGAFRNHEYLPTITLSKYRADILKSKSDYIKCYSIGPYIHYANCLLDKEKIKMEQERLGHSLLVFPTHSIEGLISSFDLKDFIEKIKSISKDYDSVRICMYYKDISLKRHLPYKKKGFEVVTAGHFNDYNFLSRLKSIIEISDMTMSNDIGTHVGYCLYLKKPHYLINSDVSFNDEKSSKEIFQNTRKVNKTNNNYDKINNIFYDFDEKITKDQYRLISYLWGFDEVKTPEELKNMFFEINENFSYLKYYFSGLKRLINILKGNRI